MSRKHLLQHFIWLLYYSKPRPPQLWPLLPFGLPIRMMHQESPLPSRVVFSRYQFFDDMDGKGKFLNRSYQIQLIEMQELQELG